AIDDKEAIQGLPFNRNAWAAGDGNGQGNRKYIHIEICYSKSGGHKFEAAEKRAAQEVAALLKQYGWDIDRVTKHQDFSGKYCPHRTLDMGWQRFLNMIQAELNGASQENGELYRVRKSWSDADSQLGAYSVLDNAKNACKNGYSVFDSNGNCMFVNSGNAQQTPSRPDVFYKVFTAEDGWLPEVKNLTDYAGVFGHAIRGLMIRLSAGDVNYKVSTLRSNSYYPVVRNHSDYAGDLKNNIDKVQILNNKLKYRVRLLNGRWLPWVIGDSDFAGLEGYSIDAIEIDSI
ncbi:MAG: N-acetylmuramoyl-L-alanine amidase, partial [Clostridium sp.]|nr:N-acetylmuramoyl-L-alanine amidase [Clostridium sp.]MDU7085211.1 N-acetylmuramoyl-L-alanine amidase [Clostridium sp.]